MRQIILDTETTGLSPEEGHRMIEIGAIELIDRRFTGNNLHFYINPDREVEAGALEVHGITNEFLQNKPLYSELADEILAYLQGAQLVIHNAPFDVGFLNHEFKLSHGAFTKIEDHCGIFDTLTYARKKHPGQRNGLDALCKRYHVDNSTRDLHGALLDAQLLAEVYLAMTGGQKSLFGGGQDAFEKNQMTSELKFKRIDLKGDLPIIHATEDELNAHHARMESIKNKDTA